MKTIIRALALILMLTSNIYADDQGELTVPEKALTASFVFKCEMVFTPSLPFDYTKNESSPEENRDFIYSWLEDDISKMSTSDAGKVQKQRMQRCLKGLKILYSDEFQNNKNMKWEGRHIEEIAAEFVTDLRAIANAVDIVLEHDKKTQNQQVDPIVTTPVDKV